MNKEQFEGQWNQLKGKIKEKWGKLTDNEITAINGKYDQFIGTLQKKYGYAKERIEEEIRNWKLEQQTVQKQPTQFDQKPQQPGQKPQQPGQKPMEQTQKPSSDKSKQQRPMR